MLRYLFQKFHILPTKPRLAEAQELIGRRGVVEHNLEDLRVEEIGDISSSLGAHGAGRCHHGWGVWLQRILAVVTARRRGLSFEGRAPPFDGVSFSFGRGSRRVAIAGRISSAIRVIALH